MHDHDGRKYTNDNVSYVYGGSGTRAPAGSVIDVRTCKDIGMLSGRVT